MKNIYPARLLAALLLILWSLPNLRGQSQPLDPGCSSAVILDSIVPTAAFFNYGSGTRMKNFTSRTRLTIGQPIVGLALGDDRNSYFGFWTSFLVAPLPPMVTATQGDLLDRIQLTWSNNPLGPFPNQGFKIFRDGVFLASVDSKTRNYNDFNVIAGRPYLYEVRGINAYGEGQPGKAIGFQVPNGVVTGWVQTPNGRPVPDVLVSLTPVQGFSAKFGPTDGAFYADTSAAGFLPPAFGDPWSLTFWIKSDPAAVANAIILELQPFTLRLRHLAGGGISLDNGGSPVFSAPFSINAWHHIAISFDGGQMRLYVNGTLVGQAPVGTVLSAKDLYIGARTNAPGWQGRLDELRLYHRTLDELSLGEVMEGTASSLTPGLKRYWKMDEQLGTKSFDILGRQKLVFCGAMFDADRPAVRTSGITNEEGYYRIESASYGTGTTFLARPSKDFYLRRALKFVRSEEDYATLPDFAVPDTATFEIWVNSAGPNGDQCLLNKTWPGNEFRLLLRENGLNNDIVLYLNGQQHNFGPLGMGYQHLAFTMTTNGANRTFTGYKNGISIGSHTFTGVSGDFFSNLANEWLLGARSSGMTQTDYYDGLIAEVAVYDTTLSPATILSHVNASRNPQEKGLLVYFALDEGSGIRLNNSGSAFLPFGNSQYGAEWSSFAPNQTTTPRVFTPGTRQVTLNPSVTSVDQVDFTDRSTVPVTGFVRYKGTDCFAPNVEILVNGARYSPAVFTDSSGKFTVEFEPGTTAILSPVFEDHQFSPSSWEVFNVVSPIAGVLFNDITTRKVKGQVAGGTCQKSIITAPPGQGQGTVCIVKVASVDGCFQRTITLDNQEGIYEFDALPPLERMTVAVTEHSNPDVKTFFQVEGGATVDLTKRDTIIDFTYFAPPEVDLVSGLLPFDSSCPTIVLQQGENVTLVIKMVERYVATVSDDGVCPLDTANFRIINGFADEVKDTAMSNGELRYKFRVGEANPSPPYLKTLQIIGTSLADRESSLVEQGVVTGTRKKENTFTTVMPQFPTIVLRDPPGDGSSSFIEKNTAVCKTTVFKSEVETGLELGVEVNATPKVVVILGTFVATETATEPVNTFNIESKLTYKRVSENSLETCISFSQKISTSSDGTIVGGPQGGDVYVGEAFNLIFGFADKVTFDSCEAKATQVLTVDPDTFATAFIYSEFFIKSSLIPYLTALAEDPGVDSSKLDLYVESKKRWEAIIKRNADLKKLAKLVRNISFDAGVTYEFSETSDTTKSASLENFINEEFAAEKIFGFRFNNAGANLKVKGLVNSSNSFRSGSGNEKVGVTTGYTLADDDPLDAFSVDVAMDSVYKTPVFRLKAGQSSCPWEEGTANREAPNLQLGQGSQFVAVNVPANEPAVFKMNLGNLSATNEDWTYGLTAIAASNPDGAIIELNGQPLNNNTIKYIVPYGESVPVTLTVKRGPIEYDYDSLQVALVSECELERNLGLSIPVADDPKFFSALYLGARFIRPCSEVQINVPEQNWVVVTNDPVQPGTIRRITVSGYNLNNTDFQLVRVQYRRSDGDGAWINIPSGVFERYNPNWSGFPTLTPAQQANVLSPIFTQFFWETDGLGDGPYEIRAVALCTGDASDRPGYSDIIKGRIDREPPSIVGVPQPSDGVYHVGDEISFTFNQHINCSKLIPADQTQLNNVGLYNTTTNELIDISITCFENKIVIDPTFDNKDYENRILRAQLAGIEDLVGNEFNGTKFNKGIWEFFVDRNELAWLTDSLGLTKYQDENRTVTVNIHNRGGYPVPFKILDVPGWVHVSPNQGTLVPNEIRPISFTIDSTLAFGHWRDTVVLETQTGQNPFFMGGSEPLPLGVRVVCRPPYGPVNIGLFQNTMNMVLRVNIEGVFSTDPEDMVAAFIDNELRGRGNVQFVPQANAWLAYLTIHGDPDDMLEPVRIEVWDASECQRYGAVLESFDFQPDNVIGIPTNPQVIHTSGLLLREVPFNFGWNWLSFNLAFPDNSLNAALSSLKHPENDLIRSQTAFSEYNSGAWFGSLPSLSNTTMYIYRADVTDTLRMQGTPIDPATTPIPMVAGWNWVGYLPNYALPINDALASLPAEFGDVAKSQVAFAQYINSTFGWVGNLKYMAPPNGYQIKLANAGNLIYPPPPSPLTGGAVLARGETETSPAAAFWSVEPTAFEHSSTLIGMLRANGQNATTSNMELGAFVGNEVRGTAQAIYIEPLDAHLFFLTTYANTPGELLRFKLYDDATEMVHDLSETLFFAPNQHQGSIENPVPFEWLTSRAEEDFGTTGGFDVSPNPFSSETTLRFVLPKAAEVTLTISDAQGREVVRRPISAVAGENVAVWNGRSDTGSWLSSGVYSVRLQTETGSAVRKVVLQRLP